MKNILLIGGSYGIGLEIAKKMALSNQVYIASRTQPSIEMNNCHYLEFDATKDDASQLALPDTLDGFMYCPGSINLKPFNRLKQDDFLSDIQINFLSMVRTLQPLLPNLKQAEKPSLVLFSTVAVQSGMPFHTSVAAAKGAIEGFAKALAAEYAPHFRVNVIAPSLTNTPLAGKLLSSEEKIEKMGERHPLKRIGTPLDIANLAQFLLSENASWITGQVIGVDGGISTLNIH